MPTQSLNIKLRACEIADLELLFEFQLDSQARFLAAFTSKETLDKSSYIAKHSRHLGDPNINSQLIMLDDIVVGSIAKFVMEGDAEITYWIDKQYWAKGIASQALRDFLFLEQTRPIFGRVAFDNIGSQKVLEKCNFVRIGSDKGFAHERQCEIEEFIYRLE